MIVVASGQLWPNLETIYACRNSLKQVLILHTSDEQRSIKPALVIEDFCRIMVPEAQIELIEISLSPTEISQVVKKEIPTLLSPTLVNMTGGNKLIFAGLLECANTIEGDCIYREIGTGGYYQIHIQNGHVSGSDFELPVNTDEINPLTLLKMHSRVRADVDVIGEPAPYLGLTELSKKLVENQYQWNLAFQQCGYTNSDNGFQFERFVASGIVAMGVGQVCMNVKDIKVTGNTIRENDIILNFNKRLWLFDLKLMGRQSETKLSDQLTTINTRVKDLGGLNAKGIVIRPNLTANKEELDSAKTYDLVILDATKTAKFFSFLHQVIQTGKDLPAELSLVDEILASSASVKSGCGFSMRTIPVTTYHENGATELSSTPLIMEEQIDSVNVIDLRATIQSLRANKEPAVIAQLTNTVNLLSTNLTSSLVQALGKEANQLDRQTMLMKFDEKKRKEIYKKIIKQIRTHKPS
ncbi:MAG: hypothetical protein H3C47_16580 [Candidatus Cloacimonetes bacterium]|nr:hypothetical protein [Candidatus Cloacimonadota bacterium]